jgi:hypothetical protein
MNAAQIVDYENKRLPPCIYGLMSKIKWRGRTVGSLKSVVRSFGPGLARVLEVVLYLAAAAWVITALYALVSLLFGGELSPMQTAYVTVACVLLASLGGAFFATFAELCGQQARDRVARRVYEALAAGREPPPYTLYLRPFASTGAFESVGVGVGAPGTVGALLGAKIELEAQVERAVRPLGPLVALGRSLEHIGAGRIEIGDDNWRPAAQLLMSKARLLVMLPSSRLGTLEEIEMILDTGLIERTVLIDPPNIEQSKDFDHAAEWRHVQAAFAKRGYEVPAETRLGRLLFYGDRRAPLFKERLDIDADDRIERLFRRVIRFTRARAAATT